MKVHEVFPQLVVSDSSAAADFYRAAFGAVEKFRLTEPSGRVGHLELELGGTILMLSDPYPEMGLVPPTPGDRVSSGIHLHVDDADATIQRAVQLGARLEREPADHFYGERSGSIFCPFGHRWLIGHSIEEMSPEEMQRRYDALFEQG